MFESTNAFRKLNGLNYFDLFWGGSDSGLPWLQYSSNNQLMLCEHDLPKIQSHARLQGSSIHFTNMIHPCLAEHDDVVGNYVGQSQLSNDRIRSWGVENPVHEPKGHLRNWLKG